MLSSPAVSCLNTKFSSANDFVPYMQALPVPSPKMKSPPWIMKSLICSGKLGWRSFGALRPFAAALLTDNSMELAPLVALWEPLCVPSLASTILSKILRRLRNRVGKQLHFHTPKGLTWERASEQVAVLRQCCTLSSSVGYYHNGFGRPTGHPIHQASDFVFNIIAILSIGMLDSAFQAEDSSLT